MAAPGSSFENNTGTSQAIPQKQKNTIYCGTDIPEISTKILHARREHALSYVTGPSGWGGANRGKSCQRTQALNGRASYNP